MYSLDVNFLKDRKLGEGPDPKPRPQPIGLMPLLAGVGVGLLPLLAVGGLYLYAGQQNSKLEQQIEEVNGQISQVDAKLAESKKLTEETNRITGETKAFASVFNQIKPWSAMLQDIRDRTPPGVAIDGITQAQVAVAPANTPSPAPAANKGGNQNGSSPSPSPAPAFTTKLEIVGYARSYNDVNDFLLTLQRSPFLKKDQTQLAGAKLIDNPVKLEQSKNQNKKPGIPQVTYELPKVVQYAIQTSLSDVPASELVRELERKGAVGLVTRIRDLQDKGVSP